jgi:hypothetical protein
MSGPTPARHLRAVESKSKPKPVAWFYIDENGEQHEATADVHKLEDRLSMAESDRSKWALKYHEVVRDKEQDALDNPLWAIAVRVFQAWAKATNHHKMAFDYKRFELVEPHLKRKQHGPEYCLAAVAGRVYDHYVDQRKNGTPLHYWEWERIFKNIGSLEESARRVPRDWREREPFAQALDSIKLLTA